MALSDAVAAAATAQQSLAGRTIIYTRGSASVTLTAVPTRTTREVDIGDGILGYIEFHDYLIEAADLVLNSSTVLPQPGDQVTDTINGTTQTLEAMPIGDEPCYRFSDCDRTLLRVHTKQVS